MNTAVQMGSNQTQKVDTLNILITEDAAAMSKMAAQKVALCIASKPNATICLPSGDTPLGMFRELVAMQKRGEVDLSKMTFVGLDEWVGMDQHTKGSCSYFVYNELINPAGIKPEQVHMFNAKSEDLQAECQKMDQFIASKGGLDLIVVGLGTNGHIALNEPGYSWNLLSHVSDLAPSTVTVGQKYFESQTELKKGITLGLKHLMNSKEAILIANGSKKTPAVKELIQGKIGEQFPASIMRTHPKGLMIVDREAAAGL